MPAPQPIPLCALCALSRLINFPLDLQRRLDLRHQLGVRLQCGKLGELALHIGRRVEGTSLALFATIQRRKRSAELLAQPNFEAMIRATAADSARKVVIFDLPPVFAGDDALIVLKSLDAYIHVVNAGETGRRQFEQAQKTMASTPCAGTVLNQYQGGMFDPYGYGGYGDPYQKYYSLED